MVSLSKGGAWLVIIGVVISVVLTIVWGVSVRRVQQQAASPQQTTENILLGQAKILMPPVAASTTVLMQQLPSFVKALILPRATGVKTNVTTYAGSKLGYQIIYSQAKTMQDAYSALMSAAKSGGWKIVQGIRANDFAYFEFTGGGLSGRATFSPDTSSSTKVVISLVQS